MGKGQSRGLKKGLRFSKGYSLLSAMQFTVQICSVFSQRKNLSDIQVFENNAVLLTYCFGTFILSVLREKQLLERRNNI